MYRLEALWADPSTPTYAAKADAATKLYGQGMGVIPREQARIDMGYSVETRRQMREWDKEENPVGQLAGLYAPTDKTGGSETPNEPAAEEVPEE